LKLRVRVFRYDPKIDAQPRYQVRSTAMENCACSTFFSTSLVVLGFNLLGDALRDALDPTSRFLATSRER